MALFNISPGLWDVIVIVGILIVVITLSSLKANKDDRREQNQLDSSDDISPK